MYSCTVKLLEKQNKYGCKHKEGAVLHVGITVLEEFGAGDACTAAKRGQSPALLTPVR